MTSRGYLLGSVTTTNAISTERDSQRKEVLETLNLELTYCSWYFGKMAFSLDFADFYDFLRFFYDERLGNSDFFEVTDVYIF